ncbi:MAG: ATP-binding cassette domain-containing protein [Clostridia bacterium]|nr:ATP-binding cassette domain-containing protein [Clostridia bacterium]
MPEQTEMIRIEGLKKVYGVGANAVTALNGINLSILKGDIHGIIGMSGAGKSTLIRCVNRLDTPTEGRILIDGQDILAMNTKDLNATRKRVSMIFQQFNLLMQKTVAKNVRYPLELAGVPKAKANQRVKELLEIVGLSDKADNYPGQLSGGQKQRVAIARALALDPEVLLCDEATSALDPMTTQSILSLLQDINRRLGITIVIITHEMAVIRQICTHVAILDGGTVAEEGSVDEVFTHTKSEAGRRLFGYVGNLDKTPETETGVPLIRIVFDGTTVNQPVISELTRKTGVAMNIIHANVDQINGKPYGQLTIERPKDEADAQKLIDELTRMNIVFQEVGA